MSAILRITFALLWFVFALLLTIKTWYTIPTFVDMMQTDFLKILFWAGFILMWISAVVIAPIIVIIQANKTP